MIELPLIFVAGILGTAHCVGMCGPFALTIGSRAAGWSSALGRQAAYTAGRVFTYATLGAAAGFGGQRVVQAWPGLVTLPALLAIAAGILLVYQGLLAAGLLPKRVIGSVGSGCLAGGLFGHFLRRGTPPDVFIAGVLTGFLPCGLVYGMLALAMATHSVVWGGLTMIVFGLGTAPAMMAVGVSGRLIGLASRRRLFAAAAWCLVVTGAISIARGVSFISAGGDTTHSCPACTLRK
jgi:sulfite exporter TauE/SafE